MVDRCSYRSWNKNALLVIMGNGFICSIITIEFQEFMEAFGQMGRTFFQTERFDEKSYRKNNKDIVRPPVPGPLSAYTYVSIVYIIIYWHIVIPTFTSLELSIYLGHLSVQWSIMGDPWKHFQLEILYPCTVCMLSSIYMGLWKLWQIHVIFHAGWESAAARLCK